jgi:phage terminase Nu1 subunit (DNA packaging protein)
MVARRSDEYRQLARECLKLANMVPAGSARDSVIDMAHEWVRLADEQEHATVLQQQQIQPDNDNKE